MRYGAVSCTILYASKKKKKKKISLVLKFGTNLGNSCHFKDRQGQVEIQLWQCRGDPPAPAVNGDQVFHSWDTCSLRNKTRGTRL